MVHQNNYSMQSKSNFQYKDEYCNNSTDTTLTTSSSEDSAHSYENRRRGRRGTRKYRPLQASDLQTRKQEHHQQQHPQQPRVQQPSSPSKNKQPMNHIFIRPNPKKVHDAPMTKRDMYFAVDCEMVGVGPNGTESALARISIVNFANEIVLDTYVKVDQAVTDYRTFVSGIRPEHIESDSAMSLARVQILASNILNGKILIGHGLENDLKVMGIQHPMSDIRDTALYTPFMRKIERENDETIHCPRRLKELVKEKLGKKIQVEGKAHSPVEDAIAAMDLYKSNRNNWEMHLIQVNKAKEEERAKSPVQDVREPMTPLRPRNMGGNRVAVDHQSARYYQASSPINMDGNQSLFSTPSPPQPAMHPFVSPNHQMGHVHQYHQNQYMHMQGTNSMHPPPVHAHAHTHNHYNQHFAVQQHGQAYGRVQHQSPQKSRVNDARRAKELAKAKVVAALHHQRIMWQQKQQQERRNRRQASAPINHHPIYVEQRTSA
mmetsp:Transcript_7483/g.10739  ORF Transcript_7483/g.10739 Transcript_7483/m.10739 type:complete len:489 (-) Transcript_7483:234-1700(-)